MLLSHPLIDSTIAAKELNFRVRDGNGCTLLAMITSLNFSEPNNESVWTDLIGSLSNTFYYAFKNNQSKNNGGQASRPISTG